MPRPYFCVIPFLAHFRCVQECCFSIQRSQQQNNERSGQKPLVVFSNAPLYLSVLSLVFSVPVIVTLSCVDREGFLCAWSDTDNFSVMGRPSSPALSSRSPHLHVQALIRNARERSSNRRSSASQVRLIGTETLRRLSFTMRYRTRVRTQ